MTPKTILIAAGVVVFAATAPALFHPWGDLRSGPAHKTPLLTGADAPDQIRLMLATKCGDCHSQNTRWPIYSRIAPTSWFIEHDVHAGRKQLDLSAWEKYSTQDQIDLLSKINTQIRQRKMPLKQYMLLHPKARLSEPEAKLIIDWAKSERKRLMTQENK